MHYEEHFKGINLNLGQWFKRSFKAISYLQFWWLFCSAVQNNLYNFGRVHNEEQLREISLNFVCMFDLILYVPSTIFQIYRDGSSWVEPVLS